MTCTKAKNKPNNLPFSKANYLLLALGALIIALGFILMALDREPYGFGVLGTTVGPITVLLGFFIEFLAIMYHKKQAN